MPERRRPARHRPSRSGIFVVLLCSLLMSIAVMSFYNLYSHDERDHVESTSRVYGEDAATT